jgi:hypothetical protein
LDLKTLYKIIGFKNKYLIDIYYMYEVVPGDWPPLGEKHAYL